MSACIHAKIAVAQKARWNQGQSPNEKIIRHNVSSSFWNDSEGVTWFQSRILKKRFLLASGGLHQTEVFCMIIKNFAP